MTRRCHWTILGVLTGISLIGLGILGGIVSERFRFDATARVRAQTMAREHEIQRLASPATTPAIDSGRRPAAWVGYIEMVDAALAQRDVTTAERAWREAHAAATQTRTWRPLVEVGDAAVRIGAVGGRRATYVARAREAYLTALLRARANRSVTGVLHVAEAFHALGDHRVVEQCLTIAEGFGATGDEETVARLRALSKRALDVRATPRPIP